MFFLNNFAQYITSIFIANRNKNLANHLQSALNIQDHVYYFGSSYLIWDHDNFSANSLSILNSKSGLFLFYPKYLPPENIGGLNHIENKCKFSWLIKLKTHKCIERAFITLNSHINQPFIVIIKNFGQFSFESSNWYENLFNSLFYLNKLIVTNNHCLILVEDKNMYSTKKSAQLERFFFPNIINF